MVAAACGMGGIHGLLSATLVWQARATKRPKSPAPSLKRFRVLEVFDVTSDEDASNDSCPFTPDTLWFFIHELARNFSIWFKPHVTLFSH